MKEKREKITLIIIIVIVAILLIVGVCFFFCKDSKNEEFGVISNYVEKSNNNAGYIDNSNDVEEGENNDSLLTGKKVNVSGPNGIITIDFNKFESELENIINKNEASIEYRKTSTCNENVNRTKSKTTLGIEKLSMIMDKLESASTIEYAPTSKECALYHITVGSKLIMFEADDPNILLVGINGDGFAFHYNESVLNFLEGLQSDTTLLKKVDISGIEKGISINIENDIVQMMYKNSTLYIRERSCSIGGLNEIYLIDNLIFVLNDAQCSKVINIFDKYGTKVYEDFKYQYSNLRIENGLIVAEARECPCLDEGSCPEGVFKAKFVYDGTKVTMEKIK